MEDNDARVRLTLRYKGGNSRGAWAFQLPPPFFPHRGQGWVPTVEHNKEQTNIANSGTTPSPTAGSSEPEPNGNEPGHDNRDDDNAGELPASWQ